MRIAVFSALGLLVAAFVLVWLLRYIDYRISPTHLKIKLLGLTLRRVSLDAIESVSKRRGSGLAEHWWNTLKPSHRMLIIRRKRGLIRNLVITPRNRYTFRTELVRAISRALGKPVPAAEPDEVEWDQPDGEDQTNRNQRSSG
jgi:hypothetical protein